MKEEHVNLTPTEKALLTWYQPNNPKYKDPLHPTLKLAGEIGELLDLYAKHMFKPGFDWADCKWCHVQRQVHHTSKAARCKAGRTTYYIPKVLDELGDIWYYLRILAWIHDEDIANTRTEEYNSFLSHIGSMYWNVSNVLLAGKSAIGNFRKIYPNLLNILDGLDCTLDQLTELNYQKLNSEDTNHGWKDAK